MVRLQISADMRGPLAALARMKAEMEKAAHHAVVHITTVAHEEAFNRAPLYEGPERTSLGPAGPYVVPGALVDHIDMRAQGLHGAVGLLPADGWGAHMVPYWRAVEYGVTGPERITFKRKPMLKFPAAAWKAAAVKTDTEHGPGRQPYHGIYSLKWVFIHRRIAPHYFMQKSFDSAWGRSGEIMREATRRIIAQWGRR